MCVADTYSLRNPNINPKPNPKHPAGTNIFLKLKTEPHTRGQEEELVMDDK